MLAMPVLETSRLTIRPFILEDLDAVHQLLDKDINAEDLHNKTMTTRRERAEWLEWSVMNYRQLANLNQPPYGDRAIVLTSTQTLIGICGFVPLLNAFEQIPNLGYQDLKGNPGRYTTEFGLFYAISPSHRHQGYATEAAQALVDYAFGQLHLRRVTATTEYENAGSMGVMRKLGMRMERNPRLEPAWLQVVGVLDNPE